MLKNLIHGSPPAFSGAGHTIALGPLLGLALVLFNHVPVSGKMLHDNPSVLLPTGHKYKQFNCVNQ